MIQYTIQYPPDVRYKAHVYYTLSEHVSHEQQMRLWICAHTFHTISKRVYGFVQTRFTGEVNAFVVSRACVSQKKNAFISLRPEASMSSDTFLQEARTFVLNASSLSLWGHYLALVSVEYSWLVLLLAQRGRTVFH